MTSCARSLIGVVAVLGILIPAAVKAAEPPATTSRQVEEDWLHTDAVRAQAAGEGKKGAPAILPEEDAAGALDGVTTGAWGFHTQHEKNPWWQVDLGRPRPLDRLVLYNRCDGGFAARAARMLVLLSHDGSEWRQAYQHDGSVFYGHPDKKPLVVALRGLEARHVRLQIPGTSYFHLDEVEIYAMGEAENCARGRPATQSSTSQWSSRPKAAPAVGRASPVSVVVERGLRLMRSLKRMGASIEEPEAELLRVATEPGLGLSPKHDGAEDRVRNLYRRARWAVRRMALANPLLDFDSILFVKRAPGRLPHMSDQYYGWWSRPGGGIYLLEGFRGASPRLQCLTEGWPAGNFLRPDISYDGKKVLFAYCKYYPQVAGMEKVEKEKLPEDAFYHLFELDIHRGADGDGRRQLTRGRYDDFDGRYLPSGEVVFLSTRKGQFIQCGRDSAQATRQGTMPDSYVRCGGDNRRPCAVFTLHAMGRDGSNLRAISAFENFEWTPSVSNDGRILYARWDYIDRFNGHFMSLWSTNPDGTNAQLVYGNYTKRPQAIFEARPIPGSNRLVFTAAAHHSIEGGSLALLDPNAGTEGERPLTRLTPEVCFPETEGWRKTYYANPYPLSEEFFLVGWSDRALPPHHGGAPVVDHRNPVNAMGIYLYDAFGNLELLYRDPAISSMYPLPVRARPKAPVYPDMVDWEKRPEGRFLVQDIYRGLEGVARGTVKRLRIIGVPPKPQPHMNNPNLGVSGEDPGKFVLGTVPVEADGSAFFRAPSGLSVFFQALDEKGLAIQTMRTLTYVQPDQTLGCIGCHEARESAPAVRPRLLASSRAPSRITAGPSGTWPLRFDRLVQPVLEKHCVRCHRPGSGVEKAAPLDLTAARSYENLLSFGKENVKNLAFERDFSLVGETTARRSLLMGLLHDHEDVRLDGDSYRRLVTWLDTYAHRQGSFSAKQEDELRALRTAWGDLLVSDP